jgi:hypothetical protein
VNQTISMPSAVSSFFDFIMDIRGRIEKATREHGRMAFRMNCRHPGSVHPLLVLTLCWFGRITRKRPGSFQEKAPTRGAVDIACSAPGSNAASCKNGSIVAMAFSLGFPSRFNQVTTYSKPPKKLIDRERQYVGVRPTRSGAHT